MSQPPVIVYVRANPHANAWSLTCAGETWISRHIGLFGAALVRRRFDLPAGYPVEFRLL